MADDDLPFLFYRMSVIVEDARQRINKNRYGFFKGDAMISTIQASLAVIPFKRSPINPASMVIPPAFVSLPNSCRKLPAAHADSRATKNNSYSIAQIQR